MTETSKQVVEFSVTEAAISELAEKYASPRVPQNQADYNVLKVNLRAVSKLRIAIDKERKEQTALALAHQRNVNSIGNDIIERLKAIESPMKLCLQEVDEAEDKKVRDQEEKEFVRLETIGKRLAKIAEYGQVSINDTLETVLKRLLRVEELDPNDSFHEFAKKAAEARHASLDSLRAAVTQLEERDRVAKEQAERQAALDKQGEAQAAAQKLIDDENERIATAANKTAAAEQAEESKRLKVLEDEEAARKIAADVEAEKLRQEGLAPDKEKLRVFAQLLREIEPPVMSSDEGKMAIDRVIDQLTLVVSEVESEAERL